ncbi:MAG TPA: ATP synthase F0 subunit B [Bryobacteraceae bacterium]|nr:ATP synthase F0 subunit B [Bryobacteraceae bacterium]
MKRATLGFLAISLLAASAALAQETKSGGAPAHDPSSLTLWNWANFLVLAGVIVYVAVRNGGPYFAARSRQIRKDMLEAGDVRKEAEERAAVVEHKLANLATDIARLKAESEQERHAETERLRQHRAAERAKIQAHAEREIESAGKAARLELKRYAAVLAVDLAEQKIRAGMTSPIQDALVRTFVRDLASSPAGSRN